MSCVVYTIDENNDTHRYKCKGDLYLKIKTINGIKCHCYKDMRLHRTDGPAVECTNGNMSWYVDGHLKKFNGQPVGYDYTTYWFLDGKCYDEDDWFDVIPNKISYMWKLLNI